tara:strand:- start:796 stop:1476 length:681 start_codon:yes stop_codon:yes gene_type:complete
VNFKLVLSIFFDIRYKIPKGGRKLKLMYTCTVCVHYTKGYKKIKMTISLQGILKHMPTDIINVIFGKMSYKPQPKELMADIRNFGLSMTMLNQLYTNEFTSPGGGAGMHPPVEWLENDLWGWLNADNALMNMFAPHIYDVWETMVRFWPDNMKSPNYAVFGQNHPPPIRRPISHYKIDCYLTNYLERKSAEIQVRIILAAMKPAQRNDFYTIMLNKYQNIPPLIHH